MSAHPDMVGDIANAICCWLNTQHLICDSRSYQYTVTYGTQTLSGIRFENIRL